MAILDRHLHAVTATETQASYCAARLMGGFRASDYLDADGFADMLRLNLAKFSFMVVDRVTDPVRGLVTTSVHPPDF